MWTIDARRALNITEARWFYEEEQAKRQSVQKEVVHPSFSRKEMQAMAVSSRDLDQPAKLPAT